MSEALDMDVRSRTASSVRDLPSVRMARGDSFLDEDAPPIQSELVDVPDDRWTQFVRALATQPLDAVSPSNGAGMFEIMPRRLVDLGLTTAPAMRTRSDEDKTIWAVGFRPVAPRWLRTNRPLTSDAFLRSPSLQYRTFARSMRDYDDRMRAGRIERDPAMSRSGALALLHRLGPQGLGTWRTTGKRLASTTAAYDRVAGLF